MKAYERLIAYAKYDTTADHESMTHPSTEKQRLLADALAGELLELGLKGVEVTKAAYVLAELPATPGCEKLPAIGLIAHIDTCPDISGSGVNPQLFRNYDGRDVSIGNGYLLSATEFPELAEQAGKTLITTDGSTLLGADDKAGIAEIVTALERIIDEKLPHGCLKIAFTTDEEVGRGVDCFDVPAFGADYAYTVDGGDIDKYSCETFNAAAAVIDIKGKNIHPGSALGRMINAAMLACEYDSLLPARERPQFTSGREGFYHMNYLSGCEESAKIKYIIRDHDRAAFEARKQRAAEAAEELNRKYGAGTVTATVTDRYYNMQEILKDFPAIEAKIIEAMKEAGIENPISEPVRGGTDGSRLSFMGLPCPNLPTGGHNFHGRFEYITVEDMDTVVSIILNLVKRA